MIGAPDRAARGRLEALAATYGVDEVMVHPVAGAHAGTDPRSSPAREETLRLPGRPEPRIRDSAAV